MVAMMSSVAPEKGWRKGPWTQEEDRLLSEYVSLHGDERWTSVAKFAGLNRSGKSWRLRWVNYLKPGLKKGQLTPLEEAIIFELHAVLGNKWSTIEKYLPGRTDNEIKNYWRTHFNKRAKPDHKKLQRRKAKEPKQVKQEQQLEHQPQEFDKKSISFHKETKFSRTQQDNKQQDMAFICSTIEDQYSFPLMSQDFSTSWPDTAVDDGLWFSLWELDEPQLVANHLNLMPNQASFGARGGVPASWPCKTKITSRFDDASYNRCYGENMFV